MIKQLLVAAAIMFSSAAFAVECNIPTEGMSQQAVKQMYDICIKEKSKAEKSDVLTQAKENVSLISDIGVVSKDFAVSIGIAAKELGIAANEFLTTPAGIFTAFIIIWKLFLIQIIGLLAVLAVVIAWIKLTRLAFTDSVETVKVKRFFGWYETNKDIRKYSTFAQMDFNQGSSFIVISIVAIILIWILLAQLVV